MRVIIRELLPKALVRDLYDLGRRNRMMAKRKPRYKRRHQPKHPWMRKVSSSTRI